MCSSENRSVTLAPALHTHDVLARVEGRVVTADQALADRRAEEAAAARNVWLSPIDDHGTRTLVARADSAGLRRFYGTVDHVAHLLSRARQPGPARNDAR